MRLLEISDDGALSLTKDLISDDDVIPRYAILSHTWTEGEEVTYDDFLNGFGHRKSGYEKIRFCQEASLRDGLKYFWVDTCCINNSNPTELQDAINSMFRWYRHAAVCYVYLSDVYINKRRVDSEHYRTTWEPAFRRSRWFTRGWTLQELLAPVIVKFFSKERKLLGDRHELRDLIHDITRLPVLALTGAPLHDFGAEERLSWSHSRKTTRKEDKIYSLLGLFGIFMPLIYGEGYDNALSRLKREIHDHKYHSLASVSFSHYDWDCLRSFSFPEQERRYNDTHVATETCDWLLEHPAYVAWSRSDRGLFWIKGNPGTGKSVLMKHATRSMRAQRCDELIISYFIHGQGSDLQRTPSGVFRALLNSLLVHFPVQLAKFRAIFEDREKRFGGHLAGRWSWDCKELEFFLLETLVQNQLNRRIAIFVDALDECGEGPARDLFAYFGDLSDRVAEGGLKIKLCLSSRHYPILGLDKFPSIYVEHGNNRDVKWYVAERLKNFRQHGNYQQIQDEVLSRAQGGFQWVYLVTESLINRNLAGKNLVRDVAACPRKLSEMYAALLSSGTEDEERIATKLFQWLLFSERPLSAQELRETLAVDANMTCTSVKQLRNHEDWIEDLGGFERYVRNISKGLIEFHSREVWEQWEASDREAQLMHHSVAEYLLGKHAKTNGAGNAGPAHFRISRSCFNYLTLEDVLAQQHLSREAFSSAFPLAPYAARYALLHVKKGEEAGLVQNDVLSAIRWSPHSAIVHQLGRLWRSLNPSYLDTPSGWPFIGSSALHVLAALGSKTAFLAALKEPGAAINARDLDGNTPLQIAILAENQGIAVEILRQPRTWQQHDRNEDNPGPDLLVSTGDPAVQFLDINAANNEGDTALDFAVAMKADGVMSNLVEHGASSGRMGLSYSLARLAISNAYTYFLGILIARNFDLAGAVCFAVEIESPDEIMQALLVGGGDLNRLEINETEISGEGGSGGEGITRHIEDSALHLACRRGLYRAVKLLLANGASATALDRDGRCPLQIALSSVNDQNHGGPKVNIIRDLLQYAPEAVEMRDRSNSTPLKTAAWSNNSGLIRILLAEGKFSSPSSALTEFFLNPVNRGSIGTVLNITESLNPADRLSIVTKFDLTAKNYKGQTVMWLAAALGVDALLDGDLTRESLNLNEKDASGASPLLEAARCINHHAVQRLLAMERIDVNTQDVFGQSPLYAASNQIFHYKSTGSVVRLLLTARGVDVNITNNRGRSSLHAAVIVGNVDVVTSLLAYDNINVNTQDREGQSPLHAAATATAATAAALTNGMADYTSIVRLLLAAGGIDVNIKDNKGRSPLYAAVTAGNTSIVRHLCSHEDIDVNHENLQDRMLLRRAAGRRDKTILKILLDTAVADVEAEDTEGRSLLSWAAETGDAEVVSMLLNTRRVNLHHLDKRGFTPLQRAEINEHEAIAAELRVHLAIHARRQ